MLENYSDFFVPLMRILDDLPDRTGESGYAIEIFKRRYGNQISPYQLSKNPRGQARWVYNIYMSRVHLLKRGFVDSPDVGIWRLTENGHQWLHDNPDATHISSDRYRAKQSGVNRALAPEETDNSADYSKTNELQAFFKNLETALREALKPILGSHVFTFQQRLNYLQIRMEGFAGCHYEIILRREVHEIALHFESSEKKSQARLRIFEPYLEELSQALKIPVKAGNLQSRGWTQVKIEGRAHSLLSPTVVVQYAKVVSRFIGATFPILQQAYQSQQIDRQARAGQETQNTDPAHTILEREIQLIRAYLAGQSTLQPSNEKLCDWVNFCYTFAMYAEGKDLFSLVCGNEVHSWYYERTMRIAKICAMRSNHA